MNCGWILRVRYIPDSPNEGPISWLETEVKASVSQDIAVL